MNRFLNPALDGTLIRLKRIAVNGGERGPLNDQGMLSVIKQIESQGSFGPDPIKLVWSVHSGLKYGAHVCTQAEVEQAEQMAQQREWTLEEGAQYAAGVRDAETLLAAYNRTEVDT